MKELFGLKSIFKEIPYSEKLKKSAARGSYFASEGKSLPSVVL